MHRRMRGSDHAPRIHGSETSGPARLWPKGCRPAGRGRRAMASVPILVINLERAVDRLARVSARLGAQGLAFERVEAVDAGRLTQGDIQRHVAGTGRWGSMTVGEVACFLSHRRCWQRIAEADGPHGLVLEDDVVPGAAVGALLSQDGWIPARADLVKLETDHKPLRLGSRIVWQGGGRKVMRLHSSHYCAAAYVVTRAAARRLLAVTERFRDAVDEVLFAEQSAVNRSLRIYQMAPAPFVQEHKQSDPSSLFDPEGFIAGRDAKQLPRLPPLVGLARDLAGIRLDVSRAAGAVTGRHRIAVVEFR